MLTSKIPRYWIFGGYQNLKDFVARMSALMHYVKV